MRCFEEPERYDPAKAKERSLEQRRFEEPYNPEVAREYRSKCRLPHPDIIPGSEEECRREMEPRGVEIHLTD